MKLTFFIISIAGILTTCGPDNSEQVATTRGVERIVVKGVEAIGKCVKIRCYKGVIDYFDEGINGILNILRRHNPQVPSKSGLDEIDEAVENLVTEARKSSDEAMDKAEGLIKKLKWAMSSGKLEGEGDVAKFIENYEANSPMKLLEDIESEIEDDILKRTEKLDEIMRLLADEIEELKNYVATIQRKFNNEDMTTMAMAMIEEIKRTIEKANKGIENIKEINASLYEVAEGIIEKLQEGINSLKTTNRQGIQGDVIALKIDELKRKLENFKRKKTNPITQQEIIETSISIKEARGYIEFEKLYTSEHASVRDTAKKLNDSIDSDKTWAEAIKKLTHHYNREGILTYIAPGNDKGIPNLYRIRTKNVYGTTIKGKDNNTPKTIIRVFQIYPEGNSIRRMYFCVATVTGVQHLILSGLVFPKNSGKKQERAFKKVAKDCQKNI